METEYVLAHNLIWGAVEYFEKFDKEFAIAQYLLEEDNDEIEFMDFEFGDDDGFILDDEESSVHELNDMIFNRIIENDFPEINQKIKKLGMSYGHITSEPLIPEDWTEKEKIKIKETYELLMTVSENPKINWKSAENQLEVLILEYPNNKQFINYLIKVKQWLGKEEDVNRLIEGCLTVT